MEPDHGQVPRCGGGHRRQARVEPLGHVHADVWDLVLFQERQGLLLVRPRHPRLVAELDGDSVVGEALLALQDVVLRLPADHEPLGELEKDRAELARGVQRHQGFGEPAPHLVDQLCRELVPIDVPLGPQFLRERLSNVLVQRLRLGGVLGEERVRLDVEHEVLRGPFRPQRRVPFAGREVVRRVHLHDGELAGVELQPLLGGLRPFRVEVPPLDQGRLGPRRDADQHLSRLLRRHPNGTASRSTRRR